MAKMTKLMILKQEIDRMKALLDDPHPGLHTWVICYNAQAEKLHKLLGGGHYDLLTEIPE